MTITNSVLLLIQTNTKLARQLNFRPHIHDTRDQSVAIGAFSHQEAC